MSGGNIIATYSNDPKLKIAIVNWDAIDDNWDDEEGALRLVGNANYIMEDLSNFTTDETIKQELKDSNF